MALPSRGPFTGIGVALVTLNRPDRLNAWTPLMGTLYFDLLERHAADPAVRADVAALATTSALAAMRWVRGSRWPRWRR